jgi:hypothetical protein
MQQTKITPNVAQTIKLHPTCIPRGKLINGYQMFGLKHTQTLLRQMCLKDRTVEDSKLQSSNVRA